MFVVGPLSVEEDRSMQISTDDGQLTSDSTFYVTVNTEKCSN